RCPAGGRPAPVARGRRRACCTVRRGAPRLPDAAQLNGSRPNFMRRHIARLLDSGNFAWSVAASLISLITIAPVLAIFVLALQSSGDTCPHLMVNVLPGALRRTLELMASVGVLPLLIGTGTAWLVTMYRFPGRSLFQWLLLLPLATPTYIIAFCYLELFD